VVAARPLQEPVARDGPFVMNRRAEIEQALEDLRTGKFMRVEPRDCRSSRVTYRAMERVERQWAASALAPGTGSTC